MIYNKKILSHFSNPQNAGLLKNADGTGEALEKNFGDFMRFYIKVENDIIVDAMFKTYGCVVAIAVSDVVCDLLRGKNLLDASKLSESDILEEIGEIREDKIIYLTLAIDGVKDTILDYHKKQEKLKKEQEELNGKVATNVSKENKDVDGFSTTTATIEENVIKNASENDKIERENIGENTTSKEYLDESTTNNENSSESVVSSEELSEDEKLRIESERIINRFLNARK